MKTVNIIMGSDPEFFLKKDGKIIGAEKVLSMFDDNKFRSDRGKVIIDGVQAELNPQPSYCRNIASGNIFNVISQFEKILPEDIKICLDQTVDIEKEELDSLIPDNRFFGCTPSYNVYGDNPIGIKDASKYYKRSAGGHIHIGVHPDGVSHTGLDPKRLVPILDIIVGNTAVLLDRSEGNIERRKHYGRAGEYRTPSHGLEYRTLSNFWLYNHTLMHLMFGLVRQAVSYTVNGRAGDIMALVNQEDIVRAINNNDFDLAMSNFKKLIPLFEELEWSDSLPMNRTTIVPFLYLVQKGYKEVFKENHGSYVGGGKSVPWCGGLQPKYNLRMGFETWARERQNEFNSTKKEEYESIVKKVWNKTL